MNKKGLSLVGLVFATILIGTYVIFAPVPGPLDDVVVSVIVGFFALQL
jgi:hypothetical protein